MTDTVLYSVPMGGLANTLVVEDQLKEVFSYRTSMMRLRFNAKPS
jgi:ligand-binding SRPBCC domain-containing protein